MPDFLRRIESQTFASIEHEEVIKACERVDIFANKVNIEDKMH